jgi:hypothetical protein
LYTVLNIIPLFSFNSFAWVVKAGIEPQFCPERRCRRRTQAEHFRQTHRAAVAIHEFAQLACSMQEDQERSESFERSHLYLMQLAPSFWSHYCSPRRARSPWITFELETRANTAVESNKYTGYLLYLLVRTSHQKHQNTLSNVAKKAA